MGIFRKVILSLVFIVSGSLIPVVYVWFTEGSALSIQTIDVKSGARAKPEELQLYLRDFIGKPLYGVDLQAVRRAAEKHPWVALAAVRRQPPRALEVWITERQPVALIKKDRLWVIDALGVAFKTAESEQELLLPLITDSKAVKVLLTHQQTAKPGGSILEVQERAEGQYQVLFVGGLEVVIGHQNSLKQWQNLVLILKSLQERQGDLAFVYLDDTPKRGQIAVRFKKG